MRPRALTSAAGVFVASARCVRRSKAPGPQCRTYGGNALDMKSLAIGAFRSGYFEQLPQMGGVSKRRVATYSSFEMTRFARKAPSERSGHFSPLSIPQARGSDESVRDHADCRIRPILRSARF